MNNLSKWLTYSGRKTQLKGTNHPLVKRDPNNFIFYRAAQRLQNREKSFTIQEILSNNDKIFIQNENIKKIIKECSPIKRRKLHRNKSMIGTKNLRLPSLNLRKVSKDTADSSSDQNTQKSTSGNQSSGKRNSFRIARSSSFVGTSKAINNSEKKRLILLKSGMKIKSFHYRTKPGEPYIPLMNLSSKHKNQPVKQLPLDNKKLSKRFMTDGCFCKYNMMTKLLGKISLFGVFDGHGPKGHLVSKVVRNFLCNYFENSTEMNVSSNRDNFYTILFDAFSAAQNYLKSLEEKLDCSKSGVSSLLLFFPDDDSHTVYCASAGNCKCVVYTQTKSYQISGEHTLNSTPERERIIEKGGLVKRETNTGPLKMYRKDNFEEGFKLTREIGNLDWEKYGVICEPEVLECNLNKEEEKFIILGTDGLWDQIDEDTAGDIVRKYYEEGNVYSAVKELEETARLNWRKKGKDSDDITAIVIFLSWERYNGV